MMNNETVSHSLDLAPARWIWFPSERTLANTFVLFRKKVHLNKRVLEATGWILADSRYRLTVNGERIQWGPAPSDPRWPDADPMELTNNLQEGENVIGVEVLYYGHGEGTWVMGKPGLLVKLDILYADGSEEQIITNHSWECMVDRAHRPGQYKRWYLRSLQEEFDARLHPCGWNLPKGGSMHGWLPAMELVGSASQPALRTNYSDYLFDSGVMEGYPAQINSRQIPLLDESLVQAWRLSETGRVLWSRDPEDWFDFRVPGCLTIEQAYDITPIDEGQQWRIPAVETRQGHILTFEWKEQLVGFPYFTIEAPEGTIVELITQEAHDPARTSWLDTHKYAWSRFMCKEGVNRFECFDFESLRWMQLHIRNHAEPAVVYDVGVRRRLYPWINKERVYCGEGELQRLFDACLNTIRNNAQETVVDGMGRERQQYSGDIGHELHALRYTFGDTALSERYLRTYSQGLTLEGYFMDCWPAYDRMVRIPQRQIGLTQWGPILDHGVQFVLDNWYHYLESGRMDALYETFPRLQRFVQYLMSLKGEDGLIPVEGLGVPTVWIDHEAYAKQRHKKCAFNLYIVGMLREAMIPLAKVFNDEASAVQYISFADELLKRTISKYWDRELGVFVNNLPWLPEEGDKTYCDRSLAASVLYDLCPDGNVEEASSILAGCPDSLGCSYPPNAGWRQRALVKLGRVDAVLNDWRNRWAAMDSVHLNNTLSEFWVGQPDSVSQWSHASIAPLYVLMMDVIGLTPAEPGFASCFLKPQLGDLDSLDVSIYTPLGPVHFQSAFNGIGHQIHVEAPRSMKLITEINSADDLTVLRI
jgi:alpha-L-rhamnosidase